MTAAIMVGMVAAILARYIGQKIMLCYSLTNNRALNHRPAWIQAG